ncbi:unnamed protein product [Cylindrotheca closterium]|uniref:Importin subunit alpha n=1 Tax=Cylindrotheca closterium TaxID=2856 RepID=A0AAD2FYD7_9STRA|nr:unnamed protein product [Cylindrotheca closterium]
MFREEERRSNFKKAIDSGDGRRRREETTRQIRKAKKDGMLLKRRMAAPVINANDTMADNVSSSGVKTTCTVADIPQLSLILQNPQSTEQQTEDAVRGFRRILSLERNPPVHAVLQAGVLPILIQCLTKNPQANTLIFEAAWALTNIASTEMTSAVVEGGAVPPLIQLLCHHIPDVREQAAWCLGNIAGDNTEFRNILLQHGALEPLLRNIAQPGSMSLLANVTWTVSNLCRGKPAPAFELVAPAIPYLADLLKKDVSIETKIDATWALSYLSDGPNERIEAIMNTDIVATLIGFLAANSTQLMTPTLRCLGNFVTGSDEQTQAVLDAGILDHILGLLESGKKSIRKEACWLVSNITAGTQEQIAMFIRRRDLIESIISNASNSQWDVRKEAVWALSNICTVGSDVQVMGLIQSGGLRPLADILAFNNMDNSVIGAALDGIDQVLAVGARNDRDYATHLDEFNGVEYIEALQEHPSNAVYEKTLKILETYFGGEEQEDENLAPAMTDSGTFGFGLSSPKQLFATGHGQAAAPLAFSFPNTAC